MNVGYEVVARVAFFAGDRESLEWAATALATCRRRPGAASYRGDRGGTSQPVRRASSRSVNSRSDRLDAAPASPRLGDRRGLHATRDPLPLGRRCRRGVDRIRAGCNRAVRRRRQRRARAVLHAHARRRARPLRRRRRTSDTTLARPARDQLRTWFRSAVDRRPRGTGHRAPPEPAPTTRPRACREPPRQRGSSVAIAIDTRTSPSCRCGSDAGPRLVAGGGDVVRTSSHAANGRARRAGGRRSHRPRSRSPTPSPPG